MGELTPLQLKATWRLWGADTELFENKRYRTKCPDREQQGDVLASLTDFSLWPRVTVPGGTLEGWGRPL